MRLKVLFWLLCSYVIFLGCTEEEKYEFPIVQTGNVVEITSSGVIFHGKIMSEGNEEIIDHGFVWGIQTEPAVNEDNYVKSLGRVVSSRFSSGITSALVSGQTYYVRAYVNNGSHIVYGRTVEFKSLGSKAPSFKDFNPKMASWGDTLIIEGENFSWLKEQNSVEFGEFPSQVINVENTRLTVLVPDELDTTDVNIRISFLNHLITSQETFKLTPPEIGSISPEQGTFKDVVTITGKHFSEGKTQVLFNGINASINSLSDNKIVTNVPGGLEEGNVEIKVVVAHQAVIDNKRFISTAPRINGISPKQGTWNDAVTIEGINFSSEVANNIVRFGNVEAEVIEATEQSLKVKVPVDLLTKNTTVSVVVREQVNEFSGKFSLDTPIIDSFTPELASFRDVISITGLNFNPEVSNSKVYFGEVEAIITEASSNKLSVIVPDEYYSETGKTTIKLVIGQLAASAKKEFELAIQTISGFNPVEADRNDRITITGSFFSPYSEFNHVFLDGIELNIVSSNENQIIASIPEGIAHGTHALKVGVAGRTVVATNPIIIYEPWQRLADFPGSRRSEAISFAIGDYGYVGGGTYNYNSLRDFYKYDPQLDSWTRLSDLPFYGDERTFISNNDNGYVFSKDEFWKYNPVADDWTELSPFPGSSIYSSRPRILFSLDDKIFVSSGLITYFIYDHEEIWEYNISTDSWTQMKRFPAPVNYSFGLVVNSTGYKTSGKFFYVYDQENDLWNQSSQQQAWTATYPAAFSINGKGYTATGGWADYSDWKIKDVYEYNLLNHSYSKLVDFPSNARTQTSYFVIGSKAYIGLGLGAYNSFFNDFWEFDPAKIKR